MRIGDVVKQIRAVLPNYTDYFGDIVAIDSIVASGGVATVTTATAHNLSSGSAVSLAGVETRTPISAVDVSGINFTFTTSLDHDLTFSWPEHEYIELGGFTDANWNTAFELKSSDNRRTFKVMSSNTTPTLTGDEYLLETDRVDGLNGVYEVTVTGTNTFTISGDFIDGTYTPINGKVFSNPRVASVIDIDRALDEYTKKDVGDFWIFVEPVDAEVSKDRSTFSDATATISNGQEMRVRLIDGFSVYIVAPTSQEIAGESALDICRHDLLLPLMKTLYGTQFDTGLTFSDGGFRTILDGHGVAAYNKAFLVYRYQFQVVMDLTDSDTVIPSGTRAFRNIDYTQSVGDDYVTDATISDLDLDIDPF